MPPPPDSRSALAEEPTTPLHRLLGQTIGHGRYQIRRVIGEGGMGTVFEAEHLALGRSVAIKILHPIQAQRRVAVQRFNQEARVAGTIGHPNICEVYDIGELEDGSPFLVMERLTGETLADRIARKKALPVVEVIEVMMQVLSGLDAAHAKGILHRDIKPENIFLNPRVGVGPLAKIIDFGVAKGMGPDSEAFQLTMTGMVMGTPFYLSPEQAGGERDLDQRTDVYACGVVLYEALTGRRPFNGSTYNALLKAILMSEPRPVTDFRPDLPPGIEYVIARAMARDRAHRYPTAVELQEALAHYHPSATTGLLTPPPPPHGTMRQSRPQAIPRPAPVPQGIVGTPNTSNAPKKDEWDDNTVYDPALQNRLALEEKRRSEPPPSLDLDDSGQRSAADLDFEEKTVRTTATSELARRMREQINRTKK